jgi:hypothetical protein
MKQVYLVVAVVAATLTAAAGIYGAWCWWRLKPSVWFWRLVRVSQGAVILQVVVLGAQTVTNEKPSGLHVLYGVLPLLVSLLAELLRAGSAQMVLESRGFESAAEVGALDEEEQRVVVMSIIQREIGVMALAAIVNVVLLARAVGTS